MDEGGLLALVVCVSRCTEPVRARLAAGAAATFEGARDPGAPPRPRGVASASSAAAADASRSGVAGRAESLTAAARLDGLSRQARDAAALAPSAGRAPLDAYAPGSRSAAARVVAARVDPAARTREPALGIQTHRRRTQGLGITVSATSVRKVLLEDGLRQRRSGAIRRGVRFYERRRRACSPATFSPPRARSCNGSTCCSPTR
jgi:hypothetical protein